MRTFQHQMGAANLVRLGLVATAMTAATFVVGPASAAPGGTPGAPVENSYIVVFKDSASPSPQLVAGYGGKVTRIYRYALRGYAVTMDSLNAERLSKDPEVKYVESDRIVTVDETQSPTPSWGLDRIDQRALPLNNSYTYPTTASNVKAYIIDTGIRVTHQDFGGRATWGTNTTGDANNTDCHGHGTHVAGTVGGSSYGVAKGVGLVAVKVLNCNGSGTTAGTIAGIDWLTNDHTTGLAVANMSLGGSFSQATNDAVTRSIGDGVVYAVAAGNSNANACNFSPSSTPSAITVGATDINDTRASFSNIGTCLDVFAPGVDIGSVWNSSNTATNTLSGTSMASPHAAGVAALIRSLNPSFTAQQVRDKLVNDATSGVVGNPGAGSPNRLLFVADGTAPPPPSTTVFSDDFETAKGWVCNPDGTDTATTGRWERGDPEQTTSAGNVMQRGDTTSGVNDLVTARLAGSSEGANDVDSGNTTCRSPAIPLPTGSLTLRFSWYLAHLNNATSADYFRVRIGSTVIFLQAGAATTRAGAWATATVNLSAYAGQTIRLTIEATDASTPSLIEAGVDDVRITNA